MNEKKIINNNNDDNNKPSKKQNKTKQYDMIQKNEFLLTELKKNFFFKCDRIKYIENNYFNSLFLEKLIKLKNHQEIEKKQKKKIYIISIGNEEFKLFKLIENI